MESSATTAGCSYFMSLEETVLTALASLIMPIKMQSNFS